MGGRGELKGKSKDEGLFADVPGPKIFKTKGGGVYRGGEIGFTTGKHFFHLMKKVIPSAWGKRLS